MWILQGGRKMSDVVSWVVEVAIKPGELDKFKTLADELVQTT